MKILLLLFAMMSVLTLSFGQRVYIDKNQKIYTDAQYNQVHKDDFFLTRSLVKRTEDTVLYLIQYYPKEEVASRFQQEGWYCGNKDSRKSIDEIIKGDFYSRVASVKLAAFNEIGKHELHYIPKKENKVDLGLAKEVITLDIEMTNKLLDLIVNFNASADDREVTFCEFDPRNAIIFFDQAGKEIGDIEICFECMQLQKSSDTIPAGSFCREASDTLQGFFRSAGIVFGTRWNEFEFDKK